MGTGVALVLGAGGPVGLAYQAGVLGALDEAGWDGRDARLVVGTSIGAVTGSLLRAGLAPADLLALVTGEELSSGGQALIAHGWAGDPLEIDLQARTRRGRPAAPGLLPRLLRRPDRLTLGLVIAALAPTGAVDTVDVSVGVDAVLAGRWPERALRIVAADLDTGERVVFGGPDGPAVGPGMAVAASCAVPSYFTPVEAGGRRCIDGGAVSPSNVDVVAAEPGPPPGHVLAVVPMGLHGPAGRRGLDLPGRWLNARQARRMLRRLERGTTAVTLLAPTADELGLMRYDAFDATHLPDIARRAAGAVRSRLDTDPALGALVARGRDQPVRGTEAIVGTAAGG